MNEYGINHSNQGFVYNGFCLDDEISLIKGEAPYLLDVASLMH